MKVDRHGQSKVLSQSEIRLLFAEGLQTDRDRALFGICLYTAARIAEACTLRIVDVYTPEGKVRSDLIIRKSNTKGKLATRCIPVIEDLRVLLVRYQPTPGQPYLFPGKPYNTRLGHITSDAAGLILRQAFKRVGIEGASSHSFRRTALTQMSNAGIPLRIVQEVSGHRNLEQLQRYLEVRPEQVRGAVASLSMLSHSHIEIPSLPDVQKKETRSISL
ncbi:MAG: tyrosine-type recombinase/integrase [Actinomycetota bacterium]